MNEKMPGDVNNLEKESFEIEESIRKRFAVLEQEFGEGYDELSSEMQDRWYDVEMEIAVGKDRKSALDHLDKFIKDLDKLFPKKEEAKE
jgi:hypothetical protein